MLAKARSRSSSETPLTWSKRAKAFLTWAASVSGSLRCLGNAYALSGSSCRSLLESSPCSVCGFQVVLVDIKPVPPVLHVSLVATRLWTIPTCRDAASSMPGANGSDYYDAATIMYEGGVHPALTRM